MYQLSIEPVPLPGTKITPTEYRKSGSMPLETVKAAHIVLGEIERPLVDFGYSMRCDRVVTVGLFSITLGTSPEAGSYWCESLGRGE